MRSRIQLLLVALLTLAAACAPPAVSSDMMAQPDESRMTAEDNPYLGGWDLTIPGGGAGWLGVALNQSYGGGRGGFRGGGQAAEPQPQYYLDSHLLWGGGSVRSTDWTYLDNGALVVVQTRSVNRRDMNGETERIQTSLETITFRVNGDALTATRMTPTQNNTAVSRTVFTGIRSPELPSAPNLSQVRYGAPIQLINSSNLDGWTLTNPDQDNGWRVENGVLINDPVHNEAEGEPRLRYGNLRTVQEFEDFRLTLEVNMPEGGNSGIYLRGIYEVQLEDSYEDSLGSLHMGALYSRITPTVKAERPAGEWQTMDITLMDRHLTVILNGTTIIDNQPILGCTGGALWSDQTRPGPLYIQGDHAAVRIRNMVLRPVID
ncbi:DUF1080 domain-containing protein [Candidatus Neomarinimicrobiota bacterium]